MDDSSIPKRSTKPHLTEEQATFLFGAKVETGETPEAFEERLIAQLKRTGIFTPDGKLNPDALTAAKEVRERGRQMADGRWQKPKKPVFAKEFRLPDTPGFGMSGVKAVVGRNEVADRVKTESVMTGIEKTPTICGGDACIAESRVPVWLLVQARDRGFTDDALLEQYPTLTQQDLDAAWAYAKAAPAEIAEAIRANEEA